MNATDTMDRQNDSEARAERTRCERCYRPNVDIVERPNELLLIADVPGVRAEDVDIQFENGTLTLSGRVQPRQDGNTNYLLREYGIGDFYRTFEVSEAIDASRITATSRDGVLTVTLPKTEAVKARKIEVKSA